LDGSTFSHCVTGVEGGGGGAGVPARMVCHEVLQHVAYRARDLECESLLRHSGGYVAGKDVPVVLGVVRGDPVGKFHVRITFAYVWGEYAQSEHELLTYLENLCYWIMNSCS
jgi:hypothetical protein